MAEKSCLERRTTQAFAGEEPVPANEGRGEALAALRGG